MFKPEESLTGKAVDYHAVHEATRSGELTWAPHTTGVPPGSRAWGATTEKKHGKKQTRYRLILTLSDKQLYGRITIGGGTTVQNPADEETAMKVWELVAE